MIQLSFIIAFCVYFIHACFWPNMIFAKFSETLDGRAPLWLTNPLYGCPICMTPWMGTYLYFMFHLMGTPEFADISLCTIFPVIACAAGINTILLLVNRIADVLKNWYEDQAEPDTED